MQSKLSRANPGGSIFAWQLAHDCDRAVLGQLLANRRRAADVGVDRRHIVGRRRRRRPQDAIQDPRAAHHRRGRGAVGRHLEHARHRQHAAPMTARRQRHLPKLPAIDAGNAVVPGQAAVEHREVGGDEVGQAQVVLQDSVEEQFRLADHRHLQQVVEFGVQDAGSAPSRRSRAGPATGRRNSR